MSSRIWWRWPGAGDANAYERARALRSRVDERPAHHETLVDQA